ncbi:hypothetical protein H4R21_005970, partial [Coemansia helicoidea]
EQKNAALAEIQKKNANQSELEESIQADTRARLSAIRAQFDANKPAAVRKLVEAVASAPLDAPPAPPAAASL